MAAPIVEFYRGTGTDHRGRTIDDVWAFDHAALESVHDYIQWLFPTTRPSGFNRWAPVLDGSSIAELRAMPDLAPRFQRSLDLLLDFYGLERVVDGDTVAIHGARTLDDRGPRWWGTGNHNHLRLTRIIDSLRLVGLVAEAQALEQALRDVRARHRTGISNETARYWAAAAGTTDRHD